MYSPDHLANLDVYVHEGADVRTEYEMPIEQLLSRAGVEMVRFDGDYAEDGRQLCVVLIFQEDLDRAYHALQASQFRFICDGKQDDSE